MPRIFGREPALWAALANAVVYFVGAFVIHLTSDQEAVVIAVASAVLGLAVALVSHDAWSAPVLGLVKAALALGLAFGLHWSADQQAIVLTLAAAVVGMFVRTQASAPVRAVDAP
jgi:hypothetical protein